MNPIRVLVVDDSAVARQSLTLLLSSDEHIEVIGVASDPFVAVERIADGVPDVLVLDIEMPRMDGLTFLDRIMAQHPIPVVICSALTSRGSRLALAALERGAVDVLDKPRLGDPAAVEESRVRLCDAVRAAAMARPRPLRPTVPPPPMSLPFARHRQRVVAVGASTGGTQAIRVLLRSLPADAPPILVVQHMPAGFTATFAQHLDAMCNLQVREARSGDVLSPGRVLIAPGDRHMELAGWGERPVVRLRTGPFVRRHRPSVDVLFGSVARIAGRDAVGVLLTGMGDDGARGLREMREAGALTIAQDEATCVVYGMPQEAVKRQGAERVLALDHIGAAILDARRSVRSA